MSLNWSARGVLFVLGAVAGLVGDHIHVDTFTTSYADSWVPVVGSSPLWFPVATGLATVLLAELRLRLPEPRTGLRVRHAAGAVAAVLAIYSLTGILHGTSVFATTVLVLALAALTGTTFGDLPGMYVGLVAAFFGTVAEIIGAAAEVFSYAGDVDGLRGVAPWLPALYFAFGIAAALLGELLTKRPVVQQ